MMNDEDLIRLLFGDEGLVRPDGSSVIEAIRHAQDKHLAKLKTLIAQREQAAYERGKREAEAVAQQERNILGKALQESSDRIDVALGDTNHG